MEIVKTKNLKKLYKKGKIDVPALNGIDCEIEKGQFVAIVGKSGSGKSTLLNLIGGLDKPSEGILTINNSDLHSLNRRQMANHRKYTVGMIFQSFNLIPSRNARENVTLALAFGGTKRKERNKKAKELLTMVGLEERISHTPTELSGGEAQRVAIARALANNPEIILADEPTGNLDSSTSDEIINILIELNKKQGKTIIMVTHDLETAEKVSDKIIRLKDGKIF